MRYAALPLSRLIALAAIVSPLGLGAPDLARAGGARLGSFEGKFRGFDVTTEPRFVRIIDLDLDGRDDVLAINAGVPGITVHYGNLDGTLGGAVPVDIADAYSGGAIDVRLFDATSDAIVDLIILEEGDLGEPDSVLVVPGNGDGTFGPGVASPVGESTQAFDLGDFDEDNHMDVVVADAFGGVVQVYLGDGALGFDLFAEFPGGDLPEHVAVGELTGDDHLDLAISDADGDVVVLYSGGGTGVFFPLPALTVSPHPGDIAVLDIRGDGASDIVVAGRDNSVVEVFLGHDDGSFDPPTTYPVLGIPEEILLTDLDRDTRLDLLVLKPNLVSVRYGTGTGTFGARFESLGGAKDGFVAGDVDGDLINDLVILDVFNNALNVLIGNGDRTFGASDIDFATGDKPAQVVVADLDGAGGPELIVANSGQSTVSVLPGNGDGTFASRVNYGVGPNPMSVATSDFDGDLAIDVVAANSGLTLDFCGPGGTVPTCCDPIIPVVCSPVDEVKSTMVSLLRGNGDNTLQPREDHLVGSQPQWVSVGDLNEDGFTDLVVSNRSDQSISVLLGVGDGTFGLKTDYATRFSPQASVIADLNADTDLDVAVVNAQSDSVSIFLGDGAGVLGLGVTFETVEAPSSLAAGELTGDSSIDLVVGGRPVVLLAGNGDGTFASPVELGVAGYADLGDLDGDGNLDLAVADGGRNAVSTLYGAGDGTFDDLHHYGTGNVPRTVEIADVDGDERLDLVVANFNDDNVTVLVNQGVVVSTGESHPAPSIALKHGRPNPAQAAAAIAFSLKHAGQVSLRVYDVRGKLVRTLTDAYRSPGLHEVRWDLRSERGLPVPAGTYFYELEGPFGREAKRLVVAR